MIPYYYGSIIIGPSGVGKSTLCKGLLQMMEQIQRKSIIINMDPANEDSYEDYLCINILELITVEDVMKMFKLGPNAALLYCFQFLLDNIKWLFDKLLKYQDHYLIFDFPGQIELYLANDSIYNLIQSLTNKNNSTLQISLVAVQLFDCLNCYQVNTFISASLVSVTVSANLSLPYLAVLNKLDLVKQYGEMPLSLQYYLEGENLKYMLEVTDQCDEEGQKFKEKYGQLTYHIAELIDSKEVVSFEPLYVENKKLIMRLILKMDKANGYYFLENLPPIYKSIQEDVGEEIDFLPTELVMELETELFESN
ncbi:unnamed protein product (macronuclear) [Paramecium tetraurelia]|uniref:GPN-loop GTPase 2 n=1 Tax=Paramecium tetraurelia TaxID=5888 RepID=A0DY23_PARTE|nr:uncharacterized protein GSPATT00021565001 [Paramecium tetraurelia]CAK87940.1 unnamed protein product [Paramecium tetraurelia]|eukprot:XP_001455337.1 hypothetical protein (macronuclear) [Paramecium tetraurelia strain d4-2]